MDEHINRSRTWNVPEIVVTAAVVSVLTTVVVLGFSDRMRNTDLPRETQIPYNTSMSVGFGSTAVPDIVASATPAVVSVVISADVPVIERYLEEYNPFGGFFGGFGFEIPRERQIGTEKQTIGGGSGFFVSADGFVITNRHVVDTDGATFSVVTHDGETYDAEVIAKDPMLDIAVLKVREGGPFTPLTFGDSDAVRLGESVIAIGNALAEFPNSVSVGVISGLSRNIIAQGSFGEREALEDVFQTDAAINPGNSGGPLLNSRGEVIGVNVAVANGSENIGFALTSNIVQEVFQSVEAFGEIRRPYLGVRYIEITEEVAKENNLPVEHGVLVVRGERRSDLAVIPGSPADKAGIEENTIIAEINGVKLDSTTHLQSEIRKYAIGETVTLTVYVDGERKMIEVRLEQAPE